MVSDADVVASAGEEEFQGGMNFSELSYSEKLDWLAQVAMFVAWLSNAKKQKNTNVIETHSSVFFI